MSIQLSALNPSANALATCPDCKHRQQALILPDADGFDLFECIACGFVFEVDCNS